MLLSWVSEKIKGISTVTLSVVLAMHTLPYLKTTRCSDNRNLMLFNIQCHPNMRSHGYVKLLNMHYELLLLQSVMAEVCSNVTTFWYLIWSGADKLWLSVWVYTSSTWDCKGTTALFCHYYILCLLAVPPVANSCLRLTGAMLMANATDSGMIQKHFFEHIQNLILMWTNGQNTTESSHFLVQDVVVV